MEAYIVKAYRSAVGKAKKGGFRNYRSDDLAVDVIKYLLGQTPELDPLLVDDVIIGCAALYPFNNDKAGELACLAVMPGYRREGYGEALMHHIELRARKSRLQDLFVLTTRTAHWFVERGFREAGIEALPRRRRELYNLQRRSKVLIKSLAETD